MFAKRPVQKYADFLQANKSSLANYLWLDQERVLSINFTSFNCILEVIIEHEVLELEISICKEEFREDTCGSSVRNWGMINWSRREGESAEMWARDKEGWVRLVSGISLSGLPEKGHLCDANRRLTVVPLLSFCIPLYSQGFRGWDKLNLGCQHLWNGELSELRVATKSSPVFWMET